MTRSNANSHLRLEGRIDAKVYDSEKLRDSTSNYDSLSKKEKMQLTRDIEPEYEDTVYNVTTDRLHEYFVDNLDPGQTVDNGSPKANLGTDWIGLGTDGQNGTSTSDVDLNNRTYEETITDVADNGKELLASTFLDSTEGNGNDFDEVGLFTKNPTDLSTDDSFMINHAQFSSVTKDNSKSVTFDVTLSFSDS